MGIEEYIAKEELIKLIVSLVKLLSKPKIPVSEVSAKIREAEKSNAGLHDAFKTD